MKKNLTLLLLLFITFNLFAANEIEITNPVIRATPPGMDMTVVFFTVNNHTQSDFKIIKVNGDFAKNFELHNMEMINGRMQMRPIDAILVLKNSITELKSGGLHIMVFGVKNTLKPGEQYQFKLILDNKKEIVVKGKVIP
jgi:copper(I)-binding protein